MIVLFKSEDIMYLQIWCIKLSTRLFISGFMSMLPFHPYDNRVQMIIFTITYAPLSLLSCFPHIKNLANKRIVK